jgi:O-antigen ligase
MALPIFWVIYQRKLTPMSWWKISIPLSLLTLPILTPFLPQNGWATVDPSRFGTYFVDPLTFGRIAIAMACLSFLSIKFTPKHQWPIILLQIIGGLIGVYYSIKSGSRTGWLAVPLIIFIYVTFFTFKNKFLHNSYCFLPNIDHRS